MSNFWSKLNRISEINFAGDRFNDLSLDNYTLFNWRGKSSKEYRCFIISGLGELRWVPSGGITNNYATPMFKNINYLLGETHGVRKLNFTIGFYWGNLKQYRELISWLSLEIVDKLILPYEPNYYYNCKIAEVSESTKLPLGQYGGEMMYYGEMKLTFELQGEDCAFAVEPDIWEYNSTSGAWNLILKEKASELRNSFKINVDKYVTSGAQIWAEAFLINNSDIDLSYEDLKGRSYFSPSLLFSLTINGDNSQNFFTDDNPFLLGMEYDSYSGQIILRRDDKILLSLDTMDTSGMKVLSDFSSYKFLLPSAFDDSQVCEGYSIGIVVKYYSGREGAQEEPLTEDEVVITSIRKVSVI